MKSNLVRCWLERKKIQSQIILYQIQRRFWNAKTTLSPWFTGLHFFLSKSKILEVTVSFFFFFPSSLLPPHTIPLGHPSALAPSIQYCASNLDWHLVSYMIFYVFQCHSPKSSHPLPLPQSPKDCSIHQCLFCCLVHRVIVTIFLNSIYMR